MAGREPAGCGAAVPVVLVGVGGASLAIAVAAEVVVARTLPPQAAVVGTEGRSAAAAACAHHGKAAQRGEGLHSWEAAFVGGGGGAAAATRTLSQRSLAVADGDRDRSGTNALAAWAPQSIQVPMPGHLAAVGPTLDAAVAEGRREGQRRLQLLPKGRADAGHLRHEHFLHFRAAVAVGFAPKNGRAPWRPPERSLPVL